MRDIIALLDQPDTTIAVVGATDNPLKYGHTIYRDLKRKGYTVFPVNPHRTSVDGDPTYASLGDIPSRPTIVNIVVRPAVVVGILEQCVALGLENVWLQPGAESPEVMELLRRHGFNYLVRSCIMVETRRR